MLSTWKRSDTNMYQLIFSVSLILSIHISQTNAKMPRTALMSKIMSKYEKGNNISPEQEVDTPKPDLVLSRMQNVLCKNFPTIPCDLIMRDNTLKKLIEKSIQQISFKKLSMYKTTQAPTYLTLFPIIDSQDLSNFVQEHNPYEKPKHKKESKRKPKPDSKRKSVFGTRKKLRKFYPHKVKYRDKARTTKKDFGDYSEEKLSMSVEIPDMTLTKKHQHFAYKVEPADAPIWRIDYMKHGEPSLNMFDYGNTNMKTGSNVVVNENVIEQAARKDILRPDVYIKRNFVRTHVNSNALE